jgi:hypothetical protein
MIYMWLGNSKIIVTLSSYNFYADCAGFAWGAIDISGEPGDIQHFDLRLQGIGAKVYNLLLKYK